MNYENKVVHIEFITATLGYTLNLYYMVVLTEQTQVLLWHNTQVRCRSAIA